MKKLSSTIKAILAMLLVTLIAFIIIFLSLNFPKVMVVALFTISFSVFFYSGFKLFKIFFDK
jgi:hypothetical protein